MIHLRTLALRETPSSYDGVVSDALLAYGVPPERVYSITTDDGTHIASSQEDMSTLLPTENCDTHVELGPAFPASAPCAAHYFHLALVDALTKREETRKNL